MNNNINELLEDCKESMEWIVDCEFWEQMKEGSSCQELITEIDHVLSKDNK